MFTRQERQHCITFERILCTKCTSFLHQFRSRLVSDTKRIQSLTTRNRNSSKLGGTCTGSRFQPVLLVPNCSANRSKNFALCSHFAVDLCTLIVACIRRGTVRSLSWYRFVLKTCDSRFVLNVSSTFANFEVNAINCLAANGSRECF